jgi:hypothetical protein
MLHINKCLPEQELDYIQSLPDVLLAKEKLAHFTDAGAVYFKITLTEGLKSTLSTSLALDLSNITEIPMRWIKGDTMPHKDQGESDFTNTYLIYLTDSSGEFVLDDTAFSIQKNSGFIFNEGILHETMNTGLMPRLLLGPMNEFAEPVGGSLLQPIYYYSTEAEAESASATDSPTTLSTNSLDFSSLYTVGHRENLFSKRPMGAPGSGGIAADIYGNIFIADPGNHVIRQVTFPNGLNLDTGLVSTYAGTQTSSILDGPRETAQFYNPKNIAIDSNGNIFVFDDTVIRVITSGGMVITLAGEPYSFGFYDGTGTAARFSSFAGLPFREDYGLTVDISGNLFVADTGNHAIRKVRFPNGLIQNGGVVTTVAGNGYPNLIDGPGVRAHFAFPTSVAVDRLGNIFVTDTQNRCIRKVSPPSGFTWDSTESEAKFTFAEGGNGIFILNDDGGVVSTVFRWGNDVNSPDFMNQEIPLGIAVDAASILYITFNQKIYKISPPTGFTWADPEANLFIPNFYNYNYMGNGSGGIATEIPMTGPYAPVGIRISNMALDTQRNMYVSVDEGSFFLKITPAGVVTLIAGSPYGRSGYKNISTLLPTIHWKIASSSTGLSPKAFVWDNGYILDHSGVYFLYPAPPGSVCFLEGTTVLCFSEGKEQYVPVEKLRKGTLVKTLRDGYKRVDLVAKEDMVNPGTDERIEQRLYKCSTSRYPELTSDLYITGCHSILVNTITDDEKAQLIKHLDRVFVTDRKYRLIACVDERAEPWNSEGTYTIWHFALEHENMKMNYGVFVNGGLLVESCSKHVLKNKSDMALV